MGQLCRNTLLITTGTCALLLIIASAKCETDIKIPSTPLRDIWKQLENDIREGDGLDAELVELANLTATQKRHFLDEDSRGSTDNSVRLLDYFRRRNREGECNPETNIYPCGALDFLGCTGNKKFYAESVIRLNWFEAWEFCRANDMHLASVESTYEQVFLELFLPKPEAGSSEGYWLSGTDFGREGLFYWMGSGKSFTYTNWNPAEPNNFNGREHCVQMISKTRSSDALRWNDVQCTKVGYVICQEPYNRKRTTPAAYDWVQERDNSHKNDILPPIPQVVLGKTDLKTYPNRPTASLNSPKHTFPDTDADDKQNHSGYERYKKRAGYSPILSALAEAAE